MFKLGLTGSIGMGKSTTAKMFAAHGCAVWDADAAVHRLYAKGGAAVPALAALWPGAIKAGAVDRAALREIIASDPDAIHKIERIVHPLVAQDRAEFIAAAPSDILVFDIPILFETGGHLAMDAVACVRVDAQTQASRVLARGTMTAAQFDQIRAKQMPNEEKCAMSDFVIDTDSMETANRQVEQIIQTIKDRQTHA